MGRQGLESGAIVAEYLSTDPNAGAPDATKYLSTDPGAGAAPPVPKGTQDTSSKEAFLKSGLPPVKEESPPFMTPIDVAGGPLGIVKAGGKAAGRGLEKILNTDIGMPGQGGIGSLLQALGPAESFGPRAATPVGVNVPGVNRMKDTVPALKGAKPAAGAEKAVDELQAQRGMSEGTTPMRRTDERASAFERAVATRDQATKPMRDAAFASGERVDSAPVTALIDKLETANPDKKVRAALKEVREVLENATTGAQNKALPPAGARVSPQQLKAMQGQAGHMDVAMADEVRQSIGRLIDQKGDKALDKHTQQLLGQLRDKLVEGTPQSYKQYLQEYSKHSKGIDEFKAAGGVRDKVATDSAAFHMLSDSDKQGRINTALNGDSPGRALSELVRDTKHNPEAAQGARTAYTQWLTKGDDVTAKKLMENWDKTRESVKSSGLMIADHVANIDKAMEGIQAAQNAPTKSVKTGLASTAGFLVGLATRHPFVMARAGEELVKGATKTQKVDDALNKALMTIAATPEGAAALAAKPTPANVEKIRAMLPTDIAAALAPAAGAQSQRKRNDPFSMDPKFSGSGGGGGAWTPTNAAGDVKVTSGSVIPQQGQTHYDDAEKAARLAQRKAKYDALPPSVKKTIGPFDPSKM